MKSIDLGGNKEMFKGASRFKTGLSSMVILFVAFVFVGCAKKVSPVVGSEGIAGGDPSSSSASSSQGGSAAQGDDGRSQDITSSGDGISPSEKAAEERVEKEKAREQAAQERAAKADQGMGMSQAKFAENVYFDFDKWTIRGDARDMLTENARWLVANVDVKVKIEGHGDERGTSEYNLALGERRARSTKRYLTNLGVSSTRISFISYGEEKGVCGQKTEGCFQKNRRAHFIVK